MRVVNPTIRIDTREWQAAAKSLFETSSRTCVDFTNGQALKVAVESVRQTQKANRTLIQYVLGATGRGVSFKTVSRGKNKGKVRTVKGFLETIEDSFAARILGKRFQETKSWGVKGDTMQERIHNFIMGRTRAAGFIASGWIGARNVLWSVVKKKPTGLMSIEGARQYGRPKGSAKPATFALRSNIQATIANTALQEFIAKSPAPGGDPMPTATKGLQAALNVAAQDMLNELARRLDPDFKKVSKH
jgi:hypothetical protein